MPKHLVLADDVHRLLTRQKRETGLNVQDIGNLILRSMLDQPLVIDLIGKRLVESGAITERAFEQLVKEAEASAASSARTVDALIHRTPHETLSSGSWEMQELCRDEGRSFQILSAWSKDRRSRPFPPHRHAGDEFFIVLTGKLLVTYGSQAEVISAPGTFHVPGDTPHSTTPAAPGTHVIVVLSPPEEAYKSVAGESAKGPRDNEVPTV